MATSERAIDRGKRTAAIIRTRLGDELRQARTARGLSQTRVALGAGISRSQLSRIERGQVPGLSLSVACRLAAVLGHELSVKAYPTGTPVRDRGQLALLQRLAQRLPPTAPWSRELPLPIANDLRAWDAGLGLGAGFVGFDAESRLTDLQATSRRTAIKLRDDPRAKAAILVVANTRHNRRVLAEHADALRSDFPLGNAALLPTLAAGIVPPANGILLI